MSAAGQPKGVALWHPITLGVGDVIETVETLRVRPPTAGDVVDAKAHGGDTAETEMRLLAALCGLGHGDMKRLHKSDYFRLQRVLESFLERPEAHGPALVRRLPTRDGS